MSEDEIDEMGMIAASLLDCAGEWNDETRLLGNVQAQDVAKLCRWVLMILDGIKQESAE